MKYNGLGLFLMEWYWSDIPNWKYNLGRQLQGHIGKCYASKCIRKYAIMVDFSAG